MISGKVLLLCAFTAASVAYVLPPRDNVTHADILEEGSDIGLFEGDMILTPEQKFNLFSTSRNGLTDKQYRWPDATVIYYISKKFNSDEKAFIKKAMKYIAKRSCVKFVRKTNAHEHYVIFTRFEDRACSSSVGYQRTRQEIHLSPRCFKSIGYVLHEILHTLGFYHMQASWDRDKYVTIVKKNIKKKYLHNFKKYSKHTANRFGVKYDYKSVLHYSSKAFSKNGEDTIVPKEPGVEIGQKIELSEGDIKRLNRMYKC